MNIAAINFLIFILFSTKPGVYEALTQRHSARPNLLKRQVLPSSSFLEESSQKDLEHMRAREDILEAKLDELIHVPFPPIAKIITLYDELSVVKENEAQLSLFLAESRLNSLNYQYQHSDTKTRRYLSKLISLANEDVETCLAKVDTERVIANQRVVSALARHSALVGDSCDVEEVGFLCFLKKLRRRMLNAPGVAKMVRFFRSKLRRKPGE